LVQDKDAKILELEGEFEDETNKLRQDRTDLQEQINQLNYIVNKLKSELAEKDNLIGRSVMSNDGEVKTLRQQLEVKKQESSQLQASIRDLRLSLKDVEADG
jgi:predicted RNase H-like nuclease (RuvC/YqgF family)